MFMRGDSGDCVEVVTKTAFVFFAAVKTVPRNELNPLKILA